MLLIAEGTQPFILPVLFVMSMYFLLDNGVYTDDFAGGSLLLFI